MKFLGLLIAGMFSVHTFAATSEMLFPIGGQKFDGAAGNVVFNGTSFVAPTVDGNGALSLTFIDTNAIVISNLSLFITGSAPRVACAGGNYILAWCNTNGAMSVLNCAVISNGVVAPGFVVGTNVARETVSLNADGTNFLAVWQSAQTNGAVLARALSAGGDPNGDTFAVAPSGQSQLYPSVGYDGTNHLVCWMEQNV